MEQEQECLPELPSDLLTVRLCGSEGNSLGLDGLAKGSEKQGLEMSSEQCLDLCGHCIAVEGLQAVSRSLVLEGSMHVTFPCFVSVQPSRHTSGFASLTDSFCKWSPNRRAHENVTGVICHPPKLFLC